MKNKLIAMLIIAAMLISSMGAVFAAEEKVITVFVDGNQIEFDVNPVSENGRTLVPMRYIFEALGAEVTWVQEENKAVAVKDDITIEITLNNNIMLRSGKEIVLDVPAKAINGRTLVPARAVAEALDAKVLWIGEEYKVDITSKKEVAEIIDENDAKARETVTAYFDAITNLDLNKMAEYCTNYDEIKAMLPEGDFIESVVDEVILQIGETEELTEEEIKEFELAMSSMLPMIKSIIEVYFENIGIATIDAKFNDGAYVYTIEYSVPNPEQVEEYFSGEEFTAKVEEIAADASLQMAIASAGKEMTDAELLEMYIELISEDFADLMNDGISKIGKQTYTETLTVVELDGKWLIELPDDESITFDYKSIIESLVQ